MEVKESRNPENAENTSINNTKIIQNFKIVRMYEIIWREEKFYT